MKKKNFSVQPSKLLWIWIFGTVTKVRTMEKTITSIAIQKLLQSLLWSCLKPPAGFAEREKKLYKWRLNCCWEWLHSLSVFVASCLWFIFFMSDKQAAVIYRRVGGFAIMKKQPLSSFVAGPGIFVSCILMFFSINFQTSSCGRWN